LAAPGIKGSDQDHQVMIFSHCCAQKLRGMEIGECIHYTWRLEECTHCACMDTRLQIRLTEKFPKMTQERLQLRLWNLSLQQQQI